MTQHVLAIGRSEMQPPKELHQVRIESADADLVDRRLCRFLHDLVDLGPSLADHLLDPRGMDAPVHKKPLERALRDLAANGVETGDDDRLGSVVDDQIYAGEGFDPIRREVAKRSEEHTSELQSPYDLVCRLL